MIPMRHSERPLVILSKAKNPGEASRFHRVWFLDPHVALRAPQDDKCGVMANPSIVILSASEESP